MSEESRQTGLRQTGSRQTDDFVAANRELWDAWTEIHEGSDFYDVAAFRAGASSLQPIELEELGEVKGKTLLHLQCHFGLDTLSWARLGARPTGVDLSPKAIALARSLSAELELPARFINSDIAALSDVLDERFDLVFTSYGVIDWLQDLSAWGRLVASYLKPGGTFYMVEFHPAALTCNDDGQWFRYSYFPSTEPIRTVEHGSYADPEASTTQTSYAWSHSLGETVTALAAAGLRIEFLHEFPYSPYDCFAFTREREPGRAVIPGSEGKAPLLFSIKATRDA